MILPLLGFTALNPKPQLRSGAVLGLFSRLQAILARRDMIRLMDKILHDFKVPKLWELPAPPKGPLIEPLWPLIVGVWGKLEGSWGV